MALWFRKKNELGADIDAMQREIKRCIGMINGGRAEKAVIELQVIYTQLDHLKKLVGK